jgi:acetyl esterase/lipase
MTSAVKAQRLLEHYFRGVDPSHPRLTHTFARGEVLPPTLIQAGGAEILSADARLLHGRLVESGTQSELEIWPGQMHVFQAMPRLVPEARIALKRGANFLSAALETTQHGAAFSGLQTS